LQNSLKLNGVGEALLEAGGLHRHALSGIPSSAAARPDLFHPAAGSVLAIAARKLGNIAAAEPGCLVSGNIGCLQHLAAARA
jgi:hypothetical protein